MKNLLTNAAMVITLAVASFNANAQITDAEEFCDGSLRFAWNYITEEDAYKVHQGYMEIASSDKVNDAQKLMSMIIFTATQEIAYTISGENQEEQLRAFSERTMQACMDRAELHTPTPEKEPETYVNIF